MAKWNDQRFEIKIAPQESALNSSSFGSPAEEEGEDDERRLMMDSKASTEICGLQELNNGCEVGGQRPATLLAIGGGGGGVKSGKGVEEAK